VFVVMYEEPTLSRSFDGMIRRTASESVGGGRNCKGSLSKCPAGSRATMLNGDDRIFD
jgi:hypothetical protein